MNNYLEQCKKLSITAREAIALRCFEKYIDQNRLGCESVNDTIEYLWKWPKIDGPDEFEPWEQNRPHLVDCGLGEPFSLEISTLLKKRRISEIEFRGIVQELVEILWVSFWGASEDELTLNSLKNVIEKTSLVKLPNIEVFEVSRFSDMGGWGNKVSKETYEYWRNA